MCETPLETRFMLAETEVRARELSEAFASLDLARFRRVACDILGLMRHIAELDVAKGRWPAIGSGPIGG